MQSLSPRQQSILNRVVDSYIETAQPVGSHFITHLFRGLYRDTYSPATVRHEMGILEDEGYLTHPHTSAGRVPTDRGYRYYVDHGLRKEDVSGACLQAMGDRWPKGAVGFEDFADEALGVLSSLTDQIGLILLLPSVPEGRVRLLIQGSSRILQKPEFQQPGKVRLLLSAFEDREEFSGWLLARARAREGVTISIGRENGTDAFLDCTLIASPVAAGRERRAVLAILGPRRMQYSRLVPLVERMTSIVGGALDSVDLG